MRSFGRLPRGLKEVFRSESVAREFKQFYERRTGQPIKLYERSVIERNGNVLLLIRVGYERKLVITSIGSKLLVGNFTADEQGEMTAGGAAYRYLVCPCNHLNAERLREYFTFTRPKVMGSILAAGMGDRIGLTTPAHIRAARRFNVFPVLAQQSVREMSRTGRSPREVLDDVSWAVLQEGYQGGFAADADHLKTEEDVAATFEAGFTMFTLDPSDHVDDEAGGYDLDILERKFKELSWKDLKCGPQEYFERYLNKRFEIQSQNHALGLEFTRDKLLRVAVKYSVALAHVSGLVEYLRDLSKGADFDLEISMDETNTPTSPLEHFFIASELKRLGIQIRSLAPRFVGRFEKAVDYIGDTDEFEKAFRDHVLIAEYCGPYKLSIHSGSDKFSIYSIMGKLGDDLIHLKTAGTSYLEALRIVARHNPQLFRGIVGYALERFEEDRKAYSISADPSALADPKEVEDERLEEVFLNENNGRQVMHITYGSILTARDGSGWLFRDHVKKVLIDHEEEYYQTVASHFERHFRAIGLWSK